VDLLQCGYSYSARHMCVHADIDECANNSLNNCKEENQECHNTLGSYECECLSGFTRKADNSCLGNSNILLCLC
jgi:hypothetical protein